MTVCIWTGFLGLFNLLLLLFLFVVGRTQYPEPGFRVLLFALVERFDLGLGLLVGGSLLFLSLGLWPAQDLHLGSLQDHTWTEFFLEHGR